MEEIALKLHWQRRPCSLLNKRNVMRKLEGSNTSSIPVVLLCKRHLEGQWDGSVVKCSVTQAWYPRERTDCWNLFSSLPMLHGIQTFVCAHMYINYFYYRDSWCLELPLVVIMRSVLESVRRAPDHPTVYRPTPDDKGSSTSIS